MMCLRWITALRESWDEYRIERGVRQLAVEQQLEQERTKLSMSRVKATCAEAGYLGARAAVQLSKIGSSVKRRVRNNGSDGCAVQGKRKGTSGG